MYYEGDQEETRMKKAKKAMRAKRKRTTHFLIIKTRVKKKRKLTQENFIMLQIIERQDL